MNLLISLTRNIIQMSTLLIPRGNLQQLFESSNPYQLTTHSGTPLLQKFQSQGKLIDTKSSRQVSQGQTPFQNSGILQTINCNSKRSNLQVSERKRPTQNNFRSAASIAEKRVYKQARSISPLYLLQTSPEKDAGVNFISMSGINAQRQRSHYNKNASYFMKSFYSHIKTSIKNQSDNYRMDVGKQKGIYSQRCNSDLKRFLNVDQPKIINENLKQMEQQVEQQFIKSATPEQLRSKPKVSVDQQSEVEQEPTEIDIQRYLREVQRQVHRTLNPHQRSRADTILQSKSDVIQLNYDLKSLKSGEKNSLRGTQNPAMLINLLLKRRNSHIAASMRTAITGVPATRKFSHAVDADDLTPVTPMRPRVESSLQNDSEKHSSPGIPEAKSQNISFTTLRESIRKQRKLDQQDYAASLEFDTIQEDIREFNNTKTRRESFIDEKQVHKTAEERQEDFQSAERRFHSLKNPFTREQYLQFRKEVGGLPDIPQNSSMENSEKKEKTNEVLRLKQQHTQREQSIRRSSLKKSDRIARGQISHPTIKFDDSNQKATSENSSQSSVTSPSNVFENSISNIRAETTQQKGLLQIPRFSRKYTMNQVTSGRLKSSDSENDQLEGTTSVQKPDHKMDSYFKYQEADTIKQLLQRKYNLFNKGCGSSSSNLGSKQRRPLYDAKNVQQEKLDDIDNSFFNQETRNRTHTFKSALSQPGMQADIVSQTSNKTIYNINIRKTPNNLPPYQVLKSEPNNSLGIPNPFAQKNRINEVDESSSIANSHLSRMKSRKSIISSDLNKSSALSQLYRLKDFKAMGNPALEGISEQRFCTFDTDYLDMKALNIQNLVLDINDQLFNDEKASQIDEEADVESNFQHLKEKLEMGHHFVKLLQIC